MVIERAIKRGIKADNEVGDRGGNGAGNVLANKAGNVLGDRVRGASTLDMIIK